MPELTWTTALAWFGVLTGAAAEWFWIVLTGGGLVVVVAVELFTREKTTRMAAIGRAVVAVVVMPAVFYGIQRVIEAPQRAAEVRDNEKRDALLTDIAARAGNPGAAKELIELRAKALFAPSTGDAERFAQELVTQLSEKQAQHKALQDESAREALKLRLEWEPFLRAFLQQFDERVAALQSHGIDLTANVVNGSVSTAEVLLVQPGPRQQPIVRSVQTTGGYVLKVHVSTGQVEFGKLTSYPTIYLVGTRGGEIDRPLMGIDFGPGRVTWDFGVGGENRRSGAYLYSREPPQGEEEFRQAMRDGLNLAFNYAVVSTTR